MGFMWLKMKPASKMSEAVTYLRYCVFFFREEFQTSNSIKFLGNVHPLRRTVRTNRQESIKPPKMDSKTKGIPSKFPHRNALFDPQNGCFQDQTGGTSPSLRSFSPFFHGNQKGAPTIWPARQLREGSAWSFGRV